MVGEYHYQDNPQQQADPWRTLYRLSGIIPFIVLLCYLIEFVTILIGGQFPLTTGDWYSLFNNNLLLGLIYVNSLDIFSISLLGVLYLAVWKTLKDVRRSLALLGGYFSIFGVVVFVIPRVVMMSVVPLSRQYTAAATENQKTALLAAGDAFGALGQPTPLTMGFVFMAVGVCIFAWGMHRSEIYPRWLIICGFLVGIFTLIGDLLVLFNPSFSGVFLGLNGLLWLVWWFGTGIWLSRHDRGG